MDQRTFRGRRRRRRRRRLAALDRQPDSGHERLASAPGQPVVLHTPEDVILFKLAWYRLGNQASEQQFKDVLGVLQVQAGRLDDAYLDRWAADLGVADLLQRARQESTV